VTEKDHYKYGLSSDKVDVEVAEKLRAQIRELEAQDEVHWKTRRTLLVERDALAADKADLLRVLGVADERIKALEALNSKLANDINCGELRIRSGSQADGGSEHG
jgi:hypothetical protein